MAREDSLDFLDMASWAQQCRGLRWLRHRCFGCRDAVVFLLFWKRIWSIWSILYTKNWFTMSHRSLGVAAMFILILVVWHYQRSSWLRTVISWTDWCLQCVSRIHAFIILYTLALTLSNPRCIVLILSAYTANLASFLVVILDAANMQDYTIRHSILHDEIMR